MRSNLSAEKREDCFVFLRLSLLVPADRSHIRLRPVRGTGTLPDAGGAGGGGYAPCLPRPGNEKSGLYADRAPRGYYLLNIRFNIQYYIMTWGRNQGLKLFHSQFYKTYSMETGEAIAE